MKTPRVISDCSDEMGLAEARAAVDEEGVVCVARHLGNTARRRCGQPVSGTDYEGVESVSRVEFEG